MGGSPKAQRVHSYLVLGLLGSSVSIIGVHAYEVAEALGRVPVAAAVLQFRFVGALLGSLTPVLLCRWLRGGTVLSVLLVAKVGALAALVFGDVVLAAVYFGNFLLGLTTGGCLVYLSTQAVRSPDGSGTQHRTVMSQQASFGAGATLSLTVASLDLAPPGWRTSTAVFGALLVSFAIAMMWSLPASFRGETERVPQPSRTSLSAPHPAPTRVRTGILRFLPLYGAVFLYAGVENGWTGWLYTWLTQTADPSGPTVEPLWLLALFWGMVTIGRLAAVLVMGRYRHLGKEIIGTASAGLVTLASVLAGLDLGFSPILVLAVFLGPIYPAILSLLGSLPRSEYLAMAMTSLTSACGSILLASNMGSVMRSAGPAALPWVLALLGLALVLFMLLAAAAARRSAPAPLERAARRPVLARPSATPSSGNSSTRPVSRSHSRPPPPGSTRT